MDQKRTGHMLTDAVFVLLITIDVKEGYIYIYMSKDIVSLSLRRSSVSLTQKVN
jgi:hypothetical protein